MPEDPTPEQVQRLIAACPEAAPIADYVLLSPRQRWGTCCPHDPECEHSFLDDTELSRWMDTPICDGEAEAWEDS
jgi:hypothetical protein